METESSKDWGFQGAQVCVLLIEHLYKGSEYSELQAVPADISSL
jgi:hypothetical protein